ncbi:hypothetical protein SANTM175S_01734 [Streptomyces antimycoticus]
MSSFDLLDDELGLLNGSVLNAWHPSLFARATQW